MKYLPSTSISIWWPVCAARVGSLRPTLEELPRQHRQISPYQAAAISPGLNDLALWPNAIRRSANQDAIMSKCKSQQTLTRLIAQILGTSLVAAKAISPVRPTLRRRPHLPRARRSGGDARRRSENILTCLTTSVR